MNISKARSAVGRANIQKRWEGKTTKVQAITQFLRDRGGKATWKEIYDNIEAYYPAAKASTEWQAGIRGVVYREQRNGRTFQVQDGSVSLLENKRARQSGRTCGRPTGDARFISAVQRLADSVYSNFEETSQPYKDARFILHRLEQDYQERISA